MKDSKKLTIGYDGDPSVGIMPGVSAVLEINYFEEESRNFLKKEMISLFREIEDDNSVGAYYEDECIDCGQLLEKCKCEENPDS